MIYTFFKQMNGTVMLIILCFIFFSSSSVTIAGTGIVLGVAVDPGAGKFYFSVIDEGKIEVANLDGSGRETFISYAAHTAPAEIALDLAEG